MKHQLLAIVAAACLFSSISIAMNASDLKKELLLLESAKEDRLSCYSYDNKSIREILNKKENLDGKEKLFLAIRSALIQHYKSVKEQESNIKVDGIIKSTEDLSMIKKVADHYNLEKEFVVETNEAIFSFSKKNKEEDSIFGITKMIDPDLMLSKDYAWKISFATNNDLHRVGIQYRNRKDNAFEIKLLFLEENIFNLLGFYHIDSFTVNITVK